MEPLTPILGSLFLGLLVGLLSSVLGIGGGILIVPLLPLLTGLSIKEAIATSVATISVVVFNNCVAFQRQGLIDWTTVQRVGGLAALGAVSSAIWTPHIQDFYLSVIFAVALCFLSYRSLSSIWRVDTGQILKPSSNLKKFGFPFIAGSLSGMSGIGAGIILSPFLIRNRLTSPEKIIPSVNAMMFLSAIAASLTFLIDATVNDRPSWVPLEIMGVLLIGAFSSSWFGRRIQSKLNPHLRARLLVLCLLLVSVKVVIVDIYFNL